VVFDFLKGMIVETKALKQREEGPFLVVMSEGLQLSYLNSTAKDIYLRFDGVKSIGDICASLLEDYDVTEETLNADIVSIVRDFQWQSLIRLKRA
jgi:hypothetical protein